MLSVQVLLPILTGLLGIVVGAVLNAWLTTRRERWNLKRDLYTRLLEHLGEAKHAMDGLYDTETTDLPGGGGSKEAWRARRDALIAQESKATDEIRRATSVAAILLSVEAVTALKALEKEWAGALDEPDLFTVFDRRLEAVTRAYDLVLAVAKRDLRIRAAR